MDLRKPNARVDRSMQVTARVDLRARPASPARPRVKVVTVPHSRSRPGSPFKPSTPPMARPTMSPSLEPRQRALTTASPKLRLPSPEDRPRSGSVAGLHHAASVSDIHASLPQPCLEPLSVDIRRSNTPPILAPIKIRSKLTGLAKAAPTDAASRSLSPPYATTRPHARPRAPSITSSFSFNDPTPSVFYPITTASPAANPHRYTPRRAPSPTRSFPSPTLSSEPHPARKSALISKVDPALVPLPPHSPPISALSISSKSSVSRPSAPLTTDQTNVTPLPNALSHARHQSMDRISPSNPFPSQADMRAHQSHSTATSPRNPFHQGESDTESDGSERQLKAAAKTNRKIADLEITNRSLLAINASLETTKNQQAKEIRDLRRKLRESRLVLPPRAYQAISSDLEGERMGDDEEDEDEDSDAEEREDETFQRIRGLIDNLIESGKRALETRPEDFRASLTTKVLNADELRSWRDSGQRTLTRDDHMGKDADKTIQGFLCPPLVTMPGNNGSPSAESDGKLASHSQGSSALPPITITHSL